MSGVQMCVFEDPEDEPPHESFLPESNLFFFLRCKNKVTSVLNKLIYTSRFRPLRNFSFIGVTTFLVLPP